MANKQIEMRKVKKIFKLYTQGVSRRKISSQTGISRNTVSKYINFFGRYKLTGYEVSSMTVEELSILFRSEQKPKTTRLSILEQYFPYFDKELKRTGVTRYLLWEEYISKHPDGFGRSQFFYWYSQWRKEVSPVMHFEHKAGDKLFIDFTGKKLTIVDEHTGEIQELEIFVCVLGSSQYTYVEACPSQKKADFIRCIENALWFYDGVPKALVVDNLKAAVTKSSRYEPKVNETFADFAEYYNTTVLPTRAYKPRDKAIVENAVRIIYTRVFAPLRNQTFHDVISINKTILEQLPSKRYELKDYANGTVHKNSHIYLSKDKHYYSAPYKYIGKKVRIVFSNSIVEIYYRQERIAIHTRVKSKYQYSTIDEHIPSFHRFVSEWSPEKFINWAGYIGEECKYFITKILDKKQHPEQSYKSCLGVLHLAKKVGNTRLNNACKRALSYQAYNYKIIQRILDKGWDTIEETTEEQTEIPFHKNIRGRNYYK